MSIVIVFVGFSFLYYYFIPFIINIIAAVIILVNLSRIKSTASLQSSSERTINCVQTIISIVLIIFALTRVIFSVVFTCISDSTSWEIYLLLSAYFIIFLAQTANFLIFVLPLMTYRNELANLIA